MSHASLCIKEGTGLRYGVAGGGGQCKGSDRFPLRNDSRSWRDRATVHRPRSGVKAHLRQRLKSTERPHLVQLDLELTVGRPPSGGRRHRHSRARCCDRQPPGCDVSADSRGLWSRQVRDDPVNGRGRVAKAPRRPCAWVRPDPAAVHGDGDEPTRPPRPLQATGALTHLSPPPQIPFQLSAYSRGPATRLDVTNREKGPRS